MNPSQFLNANAYPKVGDNARCKYVPQNSEKTITAGILDYFFYNDALSNPLVSNRKLPISGDEVLFVDRLFAFWDVTDAVLASTIQEVMLSYLEITVNDRQLYKTSLLSLLNFGSQNLGVTADQIQNSWLRQVEKIFTNPIIINSTSNVQFHLKITDALATALDDQKITLWTECFQFDKLEPYQYDALRGNQFQKIDWDMYVIESIIAGAQNTYELFVNNGQAQNLYSQLLQMSETESMQVQAMQIVFTDDNTVAPDFNLWYPRTKNRLTIFVNDVKYYDGFIGKSISLWGQYVTAKQDNALSLWQTEVLKVPILFPANSKVQISLLQGADVTPVADSPFMVRLMGEKSRIVT